MLETLKSLGRSSAIYGLGSVLQRVLLIILLPIYTRFLPPDDYGVLAVLNATGNFIRPVIWLGMGQALLWAVVYRNADERRCFSTAMSFLLAQGLVVVLLLAGAAGGLSSLTLHSPAYAHLLRLLLFTILSETVEMLFLSHARIHERAIQFTTIMALRFVVGAALSVLFLVGFKRGVLGLIEASLATTCAFALLNGFLMRGVLRPQFDTAELMRLLKFSLPLVPAQIAAVALVTADRYFLQAYRSAAEVGLYSLGYNLAMAVNLVTQAVQMGWVPQMYQIAKRPDAAHQFRRLLTYSAMGLGFIGLALSLFSREILLVLATRQYLGAERVVPLVAAAYVLSGVALMANVGINTRNKTHYTSFIIAGAAALNLALNFLLIPRWGMMGAAWSTLAAYTLQAALQVVVNQRLLPIPYEFGRLAAMGGVLVACYLISCLIPPAPLVTAIALKMLLLLAFPAALAVPGFLEPSERAALRRVIAKVFHAKG